MNSHINTFLDSYLKDPDPRYAVALSGKWGCGKTFFIERWIEGISQKKAVGAEDSFVLEPIVVSLYGMSSISEIVTAINRELYPLLHSKGAEITKKVLKVVGKIALNRNFDFDSDGNPDASLSLSLDSLGIFKSKDEAIAGNKFIVFDDFERTSIDIKDLLGFINWFVEKAECHVVIVGDFDRLKEDNKQIFHEFREKTIGRMMEIQPELDAAVEAFTHETSCHKWIPTQIDLIKRCFNRTDSRNLRILRQSIMDFNGILNQMDDVDIDSHVLKAFLASFLIIFNLYHDTKWKETIKGYSANYFYGLAGNEEYKEKISTLQQKINPISLLIEYNVLDSDFINNIVCYLEGKSTLVEFLDSRLKNEAMEPSNLQKLSIYQNLEDDEFDTLCKEVEASIISKEFSDPNLLGRAAAQLIFFDQANLRSLKKDILDKTIEKVKDFFSSCLTAEDLFTAKARFVNGCLSVRIQAPDLQRLIDTAETLYTERASMVPNRMQEILRHLSDENVNLLESIEKELAPEGKSSYELVAIFANENPSEIFNALKDMKNIGRQSFNSFLIQHYKLTSINDKALISIFKTDLDFLKELKCLIDEKISAVPQGPTQLSYRQLSETIEKEIAVITSVDRYDQQHIIDGLQLTEGIDLDEIYEESDVSRENDLELEAYLSTEQLPSASGLQS